MVNNYALHNVETMKIWCRKVLPLVYDDSLSYYEVLCKVVAKLNEVIGNENGQNTAIEALDGEVSALASAQTEQYNDLLGRIEAEVERAGRSESTLQGLIDALELSKQDKLTAGRQITISGNLISAQNRGPVIFYGDTLRYGESGLFIDHYNQGFSQYYFEVPMLKDDMFILTENQTVNGVIYNKGSLFKGNVDTASYLLFMPVVLIANMGDTLWGEITGTLANQTDLNTALSGKQDTLTAGNGINISGNVISATAQAPAWGEITGTLANQTDLNTALSGKQDTLTAGNGINISGNVISATAQAPAWGEITGTLANQTDLNTALSGKQDTLTAGTGITISGDTISADNEIVEITFNSTRDEVIGACNSGKTVILRDSELFEFYQGKTVNSEDPTRYEYHFAGVYYDPSVYRRLILAHHYFDDSPNMQIFTGYSFPFERATTITGTSAAETTTPSTKSVYDYVNAQKDLFWCEYGITTYAQITAALAANKLPVMKRNNHTYIYSNTGSSSQYIFIDIVVSTNSTTGALSYVKASVNTSDVWSASATQSFECTDNKVTAVNSSSTDYQYPSAKCLYDYVAAQKEFFVCVYGSTTYSEIITAINAGKIPILFYTVNSKNRIYTISTWQTAGIIFEWHEESSDSTIAVGNDNTWYAPNGNTYQNIADRTDYVASFSTSSQKYVSAKGVYNFSVAKSQGVANAGKFLVVGNDGNVTVVTMNQWQGGSY